MRRLVDASASGSARPISQLTYVLIEHFEFSLPPLDEQRAIAHILGTLDDKIELNRRMNETLEAMARALFKSWFVDFDPVRAKAEGRDPGLPKPLADLFPDSLRRLRAWRDSEGMEGRSNTESCEAPKRWDTEDRSSGILEWQRCLGEC